MLGRTYERENCSMARALEVVGERWSLLIIRDAMFAGSTRFTEFQRSLGIAPNILSSRLEWFVESGIMRTRPLADDPTTQEYVLTDKGRDLQAAIIALSGWGDRWAAPQGPPIVYRHQECGGRIHQRESCEHCGAEVERDRIGVELGPGAR